MLSTSLRRRLLVSVLLCVALLNGAMSAKGYFDARHEVEELFDARLAQSARLLSGLLRDDLTQLDLARLQRALRGVSQQTSKDEPNDELFVDGHHYETKLAFRWLNAQGQVRLESDNAPQHLAAEAGYTIVDSAAHRWRSFSLALEGGWVIVAERDDIRSELAQKIARRSLLPDLIGLPLIALLVWLLVRWGLAPLDALIAAIRRRHPGDLAPLLPAPNTPSEIIPLTQAINQLLQQLQNQQQREKHFIADAAHELRTPLTVLALHAENAASSPDPEVRCRALQQLSEGVSRTARLANQLLALARLETSAEQARCDLAALAREVVAEWVPMALSRAQQLSFEAPAHCWVVAAEDDIQQLLQNVISNALSYTPEGGTILLRVSEVNSSALMVIDDSGPGISPDLRERLFQRFVRGGRGHGAGLGLSIAQRAVERHGGTLQLTESQLGGFALKAHLSLA